MKIRSKSDGQPDERQRKISNDVRPNQTSYSYSSRRNEEAFNVGRGKRAKQKVVETTQFGMRRIGLIILILAILISAARVLSLSSVPVVKFTPSSSNNALTSKNGTGVYAQAVSRYLSGSIWNKNKLTLDSSGLVNYLTDKYPELASINVSVPFIDNHLVVYLTPTRPVIILVEPTAAYALDSNGRAILRGASASALHLNLPVVTDQSGLNVALGKRALTSGDVYFVEEVAGQLEAKNYTLSSMTLPANTDELDVYLAGQPYYIKFNLNNNDPRQQVGTFLATIASLKSQNVTPVKYIDVRVDGRAYYQ